MLAATTVFGCSTTNSAVSADATVTTLVGSFESGSPSTVLVVETPAPNSASAPVEPPSSSSIEPLADGTGATTSVIDTANNSVAAQPGVSTTVQGLGAPTTLPAVLAAPAGAGPAVPLPVSTTPPTPPPPPDDTVSANPVPPLPTNPTTPRPVVPTGTPTVYDAGTVGEVWVCDGEPDEPRTGFIFVRNPRDAQQVFIEVAARAWSTEEIVGSLMATQASVNDGQVLATGPFDPATGHGVRIESGDPVDFTLAANLLIVTEHPADSSTVVWSCRSVPTG